MINNNRSVIFLIPTGFILRNLINDDFIKKLKVNSDINFYLFIPGVAHADLNKIISLDNVFLRDYIQINQNLNTNRFWRRDHLKTIYYLLVLERYRRDGLEVYNSTFRQYKFYFNHHSRGGKLYLSIIKYLCRHLYFKILLDKVKKIIILKAKKSKAYKSWHDEFTKDIQNPKLVVSTHLSLGTLNEQSSDFYALIAGHYLGIQTSTIIQSWDNLYTKIAIFPEFLKHIWVWSDYMKSLFLKLNPAFELNIRPSVGSFQFNFHGKENKILSKEDFLSKKGIKNKNYILFGWNIIKYEYEFKIISGTCNVLAREYPDLTILVRKHPKDYHDGWKNLVLESNNIIIDETAPKFHLDTGLYTDGDLFYTDLINSITHSAFVVNACSTLVIDSAILDKNVINIEYDLNSEGEVYHGRFYEIANLGHFKPLKSQNGFYSLTSPVKLIEFANNIIKNPDYLSEGRKKISKMVNGDNHNPIDLFTSDCITLIKPKIKIEDNISCR